MMFLLGWGSCVLIMRLRGGLVLIGWHGWWLLLLAEGVTGCGISERKDALRLRRMNGNGRARLDIAFSDLESLVSGEVGVINDL